MGKRLTQTLSEPQSRRTKRQRRRKEAVTERKFNEFIFYPHGSYVIEFGSREEALEWARGKVSK